jgi:kumamolisin
MVCGGKEASYSPGEAIVEVCMSVFRASHLNAPATGQVADIDPEATVDLSVMLKPGASLEPQEHYRGHPLSHAEYRQRHGTKQDVLSRLRGFARKYGLIVTFEDAGAHLVKLRGTYRQAMEAFQPEHLGIYEMEDGRRYVARTGHLVLPEEIAGDVVAVMGFDQRPVAKPHFRRHKKPTAATSYTPVQVASAYQFPSGLDGSGQTIGLIELGGGYADADVAAYFSAVSVNRTGTLLSVGVDGSANAPDGSASGPDGEVQLDIEVAGSIAPAANIVVYFGPNQGSGFADAISAAVNDEANKPAIVSISWGGPESSYSQQDMNAMNQTLGQAVALGITVFVASGDNGAKDGTKADTVDFPASSPNVVGCGGTSLPPKGAEVAWNDGASGGASGGGYSTVFALPSWQSGVPGVTGKMRGVPDVAGDADPETGYQVSVDGTSTVIGGTSAVAPLYAGLFALINQSTGVRAGFVNPILYANSKAFTDITAGNNNGYDAGPGWDPVTGLGSPIGTSILAAVKAAPAGATPTS